MKGRNVREEIFGGFDENSEKNLDCIRSK